MNRDTQYYQEEKNTQQNKPQESIENMEEINDMQFFAQLVDYMRDAILSGSPIPLTNGNKRIVDVPNCMKILDDMDKNLPVAVQYGLHMYSEQDRIKDKAENAAIDRVSSAECHAQHILQSAEHDAKQIIADANHEAKAIIEDAKSRADSLVSQDAILTRANEEARTIKGEARLEASETRLKANNDAYSLLSDLESYMSGALQELQKRVKDLSDNEEE